MTISYEVGADMALILNYGGASQAIVKGLNKLTPYPSLERTVITVEEFRNDLSRQFVGGGTIGNIPYGGNYVLGDTTGQDQLKAYWLSAEKLTDVRVYLNLVDFLTVDLANDTVSAMQVSKHSAGEAGKNDAIPFSGEIVLNGRPAVFTTHYTADTIAFVPHVGGPDTITDSASGFVTAGFVAGQTLIVEGTSNNDGQYLIVTVAAGTITLRTTTDSLTVETAGSDFTLHGGTL